MKKIFQSIFSNLFPPDVNSGKVLNNSKPKDGLAVLKEDEHRLEKGKQVSVFVHDIEGQNNFEVKKVVY